MNPPGWLVDRLPEWARSIRFRYTLLYSAVLFGLAAIVVAAIYLVLLMNLRSEPVSASRGVWCPRFGGDCIRLLSLSEFERLVNSRTLKQLRNYSFGALGVLFVASLGVGWVVAGRVLRPIGRITSVARDIQATDLSRRIELPGPDDELKQLADTFDAMLARLDAAFEAQRQFTADASHELRNPLAIIRTNVDVALADPRADPEDLRHTMVVVKRASDRMARLVDDLLALARRQEPTLEHEPVDLGAAVAEASDDFVVPAAARQIVLDRAIAPGVTVVGDRDALKRAGANLLENAVRLAPSGSRIRLATGSEDDRAWIAVADEGPGIAPED
ncbi:MAG TPA: HAMP domain-containing sensor histidine kinase, partial [Actinomycetota bacterium]|nr:HAMP domain-containing sensor histidine kinase [Actinomycetota bacterium]